MITLKIKKIEPSYRVGSYYKFHIKQTKELHL